ncbi:MAG: hypothetical protein IT167_14630 [Bryobacterales bacterium]|nr:hypothetical protein [Bryobacterales bacterium]
MTTEPLWIFDPRRNFQLQGFTGRAATTTLHDASETGVSISGIFQAAEDFAVLGLYNAYDYFNHLRLKPLPRTNLQNLIVEFDFEYDHALDGAMRFDAAKYPSVSWDAMTFICGAGTPDDTYEVRLLDYATTIEGREKPATCSFEISGKEILDGGIDWLHLYFRDTRYTVTSTDCRVETTLDDKVAPAESAPGVPTYVEIPVVKVKGFSTGDTVTFERGGTNEETTRLVGVTGVSILAVITKTHAKGTYVTRETHAVHLAEKLVEMIGTPGEGVDGRFGPDQSGVFGALAREGSDYNSATLELGFKSSTADGTLYGKLGNLDRVLVTHGRTMGGSPDPNQGFRWSGGSGETYAFSGGDNNIKYHIRLPLDSLTDRRGRRVPTENCRKIYMVFAPRFELTEEALEDGCFLLDDVTDSAFDTAWQVTGADALTGGRYFVSDGVEEERVLLTKVLPGAITVVRGYEGTELRAWPAGTRMSRLPWSGFSSDVEWSATLSKLKVTGDRSLPVGGGSPRIEESDGRCKYEGFWEDYRYGAPGWPSQWWSGGHARRTAPASATDLRRVTVAYSFPEMHSLHLGTFLNTDCGKVKVEIDGVEVPGSPFDLYLFEYGGTTANLEIARNVMAGNHTVTITALYETSNGGYYFYFDYLWPLVPQDAPDAPTSYPDVSLAIDFDTDHGYKKPPAWHLWHLRKLGFLGHADVYMGVFWNNKRQRVGATYPYATIEFSGTPAAGDVVSFSIGGTTIAHAIGYGETLKNVVSHFRAAINGTFAGVWADNAFGTSTTLRIQSKAPGWAFGDLAVSPPNSVTLTLDDHMGTAGNEGDWEILDAASPVMTEGARRWIRDLAGQFASVGIQASFAFSMEVYNPPAAMRARYLRMNGGLVEPGEGVFLDVPSYQMHFGTRVRSYLRQMYRECADQIAAAGLPIVLQFGETQWWYFDNRALDPLGGMPFYDQETIDAFQAAKGHQIWPFVSNTDDPAGDPAHPFETADFLRDRIWSYCQDVISYVRATHPTAVFECLWPLDANQGAPPPDAAYRRLLMHVNLPNEWKTSAYGIKYFRCEGFDYDIWQKNTALMRATMSHAAKVLGRPASECMYLAGIYGPPDPPIAQAYGLWRQARYYSMCFWAFDQFCLNSRPVPLAAWTQSRATSATYHKPRAARAVEVARAVDIVAPAGGALNRFKLNERKLNGE